MVSMPVDVKVYTVNGASAGSSSSLPDWLTRKRAVAKGKSKRVAREQVEGTIELIQGFEFPEASNKVKTTRDGHHVIATGTYKPQIRVWDLDELSLKFERHTDAENVDFIMLSDDWTKSIHLQNDRTVELHTQGGFHYRTRIPRFGRSLAYHFPSADAFFSASGNEIYRLNLEQGRFLNPLVLQEGEDGDIVGINIIDINPAHQLLAFGVDGNGTVQFWDPRSRTSVGMLRLPRHKLSLSSLNVTQSLPGVDATAGSGLSVTAIASRSDGLSYAVGTSTGHTLLYDIRAPQPFALKDQGYGLPVKSVAWIEGGSRMAGDGMVVSADRKVIKIWDRNSPSTNFASITPANDLNHVHHIPGSGLFLTANEGIQMSTHYIPQLGPAPRWASFLENITEEMEDQTVRNVYEDYKFVERSELRGLGLDHLVGTPVLKPYMHGYFVSLKLYDTARLIVNPFAYAEHREKLIKDKMEKLAETRIRTKKEPGVKVNKALAEKIQREAEREKRREERRRLRKVQAAEERVDQEMDVDENEDLAGQTQSQAQKPNLLNDPRFKQLFEDPEFTVDENTREYALLNPSAAAQKRAADRGTGKQKTAVEDEEEESEKMSSDGLDKSESENDDNSDDSSDAGELNKYDPRARPGQKNERVQQAYTRNREQNRIANVNFVPLAARTEASRSNNSINKSVSFGERRASGTAPKGKGRSLHDDDMATFGADGGMEMSWMPSSTVVADHESTTRSGRSKKEVKRKGVETFGVGMEKGNEDRVADMSESERKGRTQRRKGMRSGSKNTFRRLH